MTKRPCSMRDNPRQIHLGGEAAKRAGDASNDARMQAAGNRALRIAQKAMREGRGGLIEDGEGGFVIVEK